MNYIENLLKGRKVEWKTLGEVCELKRGKPITSKELKEGEIPVIAGGQKPAYFHSEFNRDNETIVIAGSGAYAGFVSYWNEPIFVSDAFSIKPNNEDLICKYVFYFLKDKQDFLYGMKKGGGVPHVYAKDVAKIPIPLPPLEVQREIADILDKFTELEKELEKELELRKKQYEHYRNQLLIFTPPHYNELILNNIQWKTLGEVCSVLRGRRLTKRDLIENEKYPVYHGGIEPIGFYDQNNREANSTMIINVGASAGTVGYSNEKFWSSDGCFCFSHTDILNQKFLFYFLQNIENQIKSKVRKAGIPTLDNRVVEKLPIPIPPIEEQKRIVNILDKFDALVNDISEGLPAEIIARRKQYEYYREQLLSFKE